MRVNFVDDNGSARSIDDVVDAIAAGQRVCSPRGLRGWQEHGNSQSVPSADPPGHQLTVTIPVTHTTQQSHASSADSASHGLSSPLAESEAIDHAQSRRAACGPVAITEFRIARRSSPHPIQAPP